MANSEDKEYQNSDNHEENMTKNPNKSMHQKIQYNHFRRNKGQNNLIYSNYPKHDSNFYQRFPDNIHETYSHVRTERENYEDLTSTLESRAPTYELSLTPYNNNYQRNCFRRDNHSNNYSYDSNSERFKNKKQNVSAFSNLDNFTNYGHGNYDIKNKSTKQNRSNYRRKTKSKMEDLCQRESFIKQLQQQKYECLICVNSVKRDAAIWSCGNCYNMFHIGCIKKWAKSSTNVQNNQKDWRCPACQKCYDVTDKFAYLCFCRKVTNPSDVQQGSIYIPHSCGEVCDKDRGGSVQCPHKCNILCHPGPCPPCESSVNRKCHCGKTQMTIRCTADSSQMSCGEVCSRLLQCGVHKCERICHEGDCGLCQIIVEKSCWCPRESRKSFLCGTEEAAKDGFCCGELCGRPRDCNRHFCDDVCHSGQCGYCELVPDRVLTCCCGKNMLSDLRVKRVTCDDPLVCCGDACGRVHSRCGHSCLQQCHTGQCVPCPLSREIRCRCRKSLQLVDCSSAEEALCRTKCQVKLSCGKHRCSIVCCGMSLHICLELCGKLLSCRTHRCDQQCGHPGTCASCSNVSFYEQYCECGQTVALPPIACGQKPPTCNELCSREHQCNHPIRHSCHSEPSCPPCTELMSKSCPGGHTIMQHVPCFRPVVTCGVECGKQIPMCDHLCSRLCHEGECITNDIICKQPCQKIRSECGHSCGLPCHSGECIDRMLCTVDIVISCSCLLRSNRVQCHKLQTIRLNEKALMENDIYVFDESGELRLNCSDSCNKLDLSFIYFNNPSTERLSVALKYYLKYFEEFCRENFHFVVSVEKVIRSIHDRSILDSKNPVKYCFQNVSCKQAAFIRRFTSIHFVKCRVANNFDENRSTVIIETTKETAIPNFVLTEQIWEKYFTIMK